MNVTSGSVDVFDSSIDNASGDPVVTPIMPLPVEIPSAATIGPSGGSVRSSDGGLTLKVPAGALGAPTPISISVTTSDAPDALGPGYDLSPGGLSFAKPAILGLRYGTAELPADRIGGAAVVVLAGADWSGLSGGRIDESSRSLLIRLRNTSPSASASAAPTPLAKSGPSRFGASAVFQWKGPNLRDGFDWVPTGGRLTLTASFRIPPSSTGLEELVVPLNGEEVSR